MGRTKGNYHNLEVGQSYDSKPASINLVEPMAEVKGGVRRRGGGAGFCMIGCNLWAWFGNFMSCPVLGTAFFLFGFSIAM